MKSYETNRTILTPTLTTDAAFILQLLNTPKWLQFICDRNVHTQLEAEHYIEERRLPQLHRLGFGNYTVIRKSDQVKIGTCGLYDREGMEGLDIGFAFLPAFEGKGYAFEAAQKLMEIALNEWQIVIINAYTDVNNTSSQKLLTRLGFTNMGETIFPGEIEHCLHYKKEMQ